MSAAAPDPSRKAAWLLAGALVAGLLAVAVLLFGRRAERGAFAEHYSTFRATPDGAKAAYLVLQRLGYRVARHAEETFALDGLAIFVVLEPARPYGDEEAAALKAFVADGGCLVYASTVEGEIHRAFGIDLVTVSATAAIGEAVPAIASVYAAGVRTLAPDKHPRALRSVAPNAVPIFRRRGKGTDGSDIDAVEAIAVREGRGKALIFADPGLFTNRALEKADNAALLTAIASAHASPGGGRIAFDEYHHGFQAERGVVGYLGRRALAPALAQALLAFAVLAVALGGRRGRPVVLEEERPPESREHIRAMAEIFAKARLIPHCAERLHKAIIRDIEVALGAAAQPGGGEAIVEGLRRRGVKSFRGLEKIGKRHARIAAQGGAGRAVPELELLLFAREVARFEEDCRQAMGQRFGEI